jgi:hypothetical protein
MEWSESIPQELIEQITVSNDIGVTGREKDMRRIDPPPSERILGPLICFVLGAALVVAGIRSAPDVAANDSEPASPEVCEPAEIAPQQLPVGDELVSEPMVRSGFAIYRLQNPAPGNGLQQLQVDQESETAENLRVLFEFDRRDPA